MNEITAASEASPLPATSLASMPGAVDRFVCIVMPCLNEAGFIGTAIDTITPRADGANGTPRADGANGTPRADGANGLPFDYEILVVDGGSTDGTIELIERKSRENPRIRLLHNPRRLQSAAVNLAAELADPAATVLLRADSHAAYPAGFVLACVAALRRTGAQSVVVTMDTVGTGCFQQAAAAAQNSLLGNGGSAHRRRGQSKFVDHGHHAAFDRAFYRQVGGYDESLRANEDVDLDMRLQQAGGRIWLEAAVPMTYFPRDTMTGLARQYFHYGQGRALTYRSHRYRLKLRQLAPVVVTAGTIGGILLALVLHPLFALVPVAYALLCLAWGLVAAGRGGRLCLAGMGLAAAIMHHAWAFGFATGLLKSPPARAR